ncbi:MAG: gamma-glutamyltransferase [Gammaproteobacteria bacterium]|nr:gamma-glutamyltransferase [Gammaproteobacteria bacterium]
MSSQQIGFTAPHWAATEAGLSILRQGGTATEAMVAAAAVISVVYPHMNSIGGDGFWLVHEKGQPTPLAIDACGRSASDLSYYDDIDSLPGRGGKACLTQAATVAGWQLALDLDARASLPLSVLLEPAIQYAEDGIEVSESMARAIAKVMTEDNVPESFLRLYSLNDKPLQQGDLFRNPDLAETFRTLVNNGLFDFYRGEVAQKITATLEAVDSPLSPEDHRSTRAEQVRPLKLKLDNLSCFNLPAPTQGVHSMQILGQLDQLKHLPDSEADWAHLVIEATKQSFNDKPDLWADPDYVAVSYFDALDSSVLKAKALAIDPERAEPWPFDNEPGDTIWMGACDRHGQLVSFIQSIYWEFGTANVIEDAGFVWNTRGVSFSLDPDDINVLAPNKKPRHTLNPALAVFNNGKRLSYGTMGGEGQPQTQAILFSRFVWQGYTLEQAIAEGRWLLGRTWGDDSNDLKVEANIAARIGDELTARGHQWQSVDAVNESMGHAGAIYDDHGQLTAATDPRSDGKAVTE